jgi:hypothetical protein
MTTVYKHVLKDALDRVARERAKQGDDVPSRPLRNAPAETKRTKAEDKAQEVYALEVERQAQAITDGETYRARIDMARRVRQAIPVIEMLDRRNSLRRSQAEIPEGLGLLERMAMRDGYDRSIADLSEQNVYNPTLLAIFEALERDGKVDPQVFLGPDPDSADDVTRAGVQAACAILGLDVGKSALTKAEIYAKAARKAPAGKPKPKQPVTKAELTEYIAKRVEVEFAKRGTDVRKEMAEWRKEQGL